MGPRLALVLALLLVPRVAGASPILVTSSDEGALDYGLFRAVDYGPPVFSSVDVSTDGVRRFVRSGGRTEFGATSGPLLSLTLETDARGAVTESRYVYDGGTFEMFFQLENDTGDVAEGKFIAPIIGPMTVRVRESDDPLGDSAEVSYRLGRGLFDAPLARALGVRRQTTGGLVEDPFLAFGTGDYTTIERRLDEGAATVRIDVDVPEPASLTLVVVGGLGLFAQRGQRKRRSRNRVDGA